MKKTKRTVLFLIVILIWISADALHARAHKRQRVRESQKRVWVDYGPAVVEIEGLLVVKTYFGPPNYGEDPKTDSKEDLPVLLLSKPVSVRKTSDPNAWYERDSVQNVRQMELVLPMPHKQLIGKKVIIKGKLFGAFTGHHHTAVLMDVQSIRLAKSH